MKKLVLIGMSLLISSQVAFAKDDWFERDLRALKADVRAEIAQLYNDTHQNAAKMRLDILKTSDELSRAIETRADSGVKNKYIDKLTEEIVELNDDVKESYKNMGAKAGNATSKFSDYLSDDDGYDKLHGRLYSADGVKTVYKLLDEAGVNTPTKRQVMSLYGTRIAQADNTLQNAYNKYSGFWSAGITSGREFDKARKEYSMAVKGVVTLASEIYAEELAKLDPATISKVAIERQKLSDKEKYKVQMRANEVNLKTQQRLNGINR